MRIAYVHGFASSGNARMVSILKKYLPEDVVVSYDMPINPSEAIEFLREKVAEDDIDLVVGTSLGAYYALHTYGCAKIAMNPPFNPNTVLDQFIGEEMEFLNPRQDGAKTFRWTESCHNQLEYYNKELAYPDMELLMESFLYFGTEDDVVTDNELFKVYWTKSFMPGGHRVSEEVFREYVLPKVLEIKEYFK